MRTRSICLDIRGWLSFSSNLFLDLSTTHMVKILNLVYEIDIFFTIPILSIFTGDSLGVLLSLACSRSTEVRRDKKGQLPLSWFH